MADGMQSRSDAGREISYHFTARVVLLA